MAQCLVYAASNVPISATAMCFGSNCFCSSMNEIEAVDMDMSAHSTCQVDETR